MTALWVHSYEHLQITKNCRQTHNSSLMMDLHQRSGILHAPLQSLVSTNVPKAANDYRGVVSFPTQGALVDSSADTRGGISPAFTFAHGTLVDDIVGGTSLAPGAVMGDAISEKVRII
jgi:hypothetical protein